MRKKICYGERSRLSFTHAKHGAGRIHDSREASEKIRVKSFASGIFNSVIKTIICPLEKHFVKTSRFFVVSSRRDVKTGSFVIPFPNKETSNPFRCLHEFLPNLPKTTSKTAPDNQNATRISPSV
jgi:hypothetical protein